MFGHIYYFFGLIIFLLDMGLLMKFSKIHKTRNWFESFVKVTKRKPNKQDMAGNDLKDIMSFNQTLSINFLWIFFGLITNSWKFFLSLLVINFILNFVILNTKRLKNINFGIEFTKFLLITISVGFIVINHFHLHIDIFDYIFKR
jgi:hypothetical protein